MDYTAVLFKGGDVDMRLLESHDELEAIVEFRSIVAENPSIYAQLWSLMEGWTDLDADNADDMIIIHDPRCSRIDVVVVERDGIEYVFGVEDLSDVERFADARIYAYEGSIESFYKDDDWMDYLRDR